MAIAEPDIQITTKVEFEEQVQHYVCCEVSDDFVGVTKSFCGKTIMIDTASFGYSDCAQCVEVATRPGCPLGYDCLPVD